VPDLSAPEPGRAARGGRPRDPSRDEAIRAAILEVLARDGYAALTMDAVAAAAGVGKATIYRRWRTKSDLVADAVADLGDEEFDAPDTGALEGDLRQLLHALVGATNGPLGAATLALLSALPHEPDLRTAFREGPMGQMGEAFRQVWARAVDRGEVPAGVLGSAVTSSASSPILQRWLFSEQPVDDAFADEVLDDVVLPLIRRSSGG
jgi:AcrR family transcriptional regulator